MDSSDKLAATLLLLLLLLLCSCRIPNALSK